MGIVSGKELLAGKHEFEYNKNQRLLEMLANGKRLPKEGSEVLSTKETLVSKTTKKAVILKFESKFEKEFKKYAGKKAPTEKIYNKVVGTAKEKETVFSA